MKLIIDDADVNAIKRLISYMPIDGVTTNPSILAKAGRPPYEVLTEIRDIIGPDLELHVQAVSRDAAGMVAEAGRICAELGANTFVKIPATPEGLRAIRQLHENGVNVTATGVYRTLQAFLAAKAGADYVAPYVNRIDNLEDDGVQVAVDIHNVLISSGLDTQVLAASFKNARQVLRLAQAGVGAATVAPAVLDSTIGRDFVENAIEQFIADFEGLCGVGATMLTC